MGIAPADGQAYAKAIRALYEKSERDILEKVARRIAKGIKTDPDQQHWLDAKLNEVRRHISEVDRILAALNKNGPKAIQDLVIQGYLSGMISADTDLSTYGVPMSENPVSVPAGGGTAELVGSFGATHAAAINSLVAATNGGLEGAHMHMIRSAEDAYRNVITDVLGSAVGGIDTRQQATQKALNKFADKGIGAFTDKGGREWDIATYAEMSTRTGMAHAHIQGHINRMTQQGYDLVIVSDHPEESPLCRPHENQIYSISGNSTTYKSLQWAIANGLFHPNCRHTINAYIEGLTEPPPETKGDPEGYEIRKHHRALEVQVRKWKKREVVAITDKEKRLARDKVKHWQGRLRTFTAETGRRRQYTREQIFMRGLGKPSAPIGKPSNSSPAATIVPLRQIVTEAKKEVNKSVGEIGYSLTQFADQATDGRDLLRIIRESGNKDALDEFRRRLVQLENDGMGGHTARMNAVFNEMRTKVEPPPKVDLETKEFIPDETKLNKELWRVNDSGTPLSDLAGSDAKIPNSDIDYKGIDKKAIDSIYGGRVTIEGLAHTYNPDPERFDIRFVKLTASENPAIAASGIRMNVIDKKTKQNVGSITRIIAKKDGKYIVDNSYFELDKSVQGGGLATRLYFQQEQLLKEIANGSPIKINIHANIDVGGYAWTRYGFDFDEDMADLFRFRTERMIEDVVAVKMQNGDYGEMTKDRWKTEKKQILSDYLVSMGYNSLDDIRHAWQFAALDDGQVWDIGITKTGHFGKKLLLGSNWKGTKEINTDGDGEKIGNLYYESKGVK